MTVARRKLIDYTRREKEDDLLRETQARQRNGDSVADAGEMNIPDGRLRLIFACCHPALNPEVQRLARRAEPVPPYRRRVSLPLISWGAPASHLPRRGVLSSPSAVLRCVQPRPPERPGDLRNVKFASRYSGELYPGNPQRSRRRCYQRSMHVLRNGPRAFGR
jgi:hypothetical protein